MPNQQDDAELRGRFEKLALFVPLADGDGMVLFEPDAHEDATAALYGCCADGDNPGAPELTGRISSYTPGNGKTYPILWVAHGSRAFNFLYQQGEEGRLPLLVAEDCDPVRQQAAIRARLAQEARIPEIHGRHALLYASVDGGDMAYVVFDEGTANAALAAAEDARRRGLDAPLFEGDETIEARELIVPHEGAHTYYGFYIATRSPEFRLLQRMEAGGAMQRVDCTPEGEIDPQKIQDALYRQKVPEPEPASVRTQFALAALYRHALACGTVEGSDMAYVLFDKGHAREADAALRQLQNAGAGTRDLSVPQIPDQAAGYTLLSLPVDTDAFRFLKTKAASEKGGIIAVHSTEGLADCLQRMKFLVLTQQAFKRSPNAQLN